MSFLIFWLLKFKYHRIFFLKVFKISADMFESVKKKILVHTLFQGSCCVTIFPDASKRQGALATVDHADIRGLVTA